LSNIVEMYEIRQIASTDNDLSLLLAKADDTNKTAKPKSAEQKLIQAKKENDKGYTLRVIDKGNKATKVFDEPDENNLDNYLKHNKNIVSRLVGANKDNIPVTITFADPLTKDELEQSLANIDFELEECQGRAYDSHNIKSTFAGLASSFKSIDLTSFENKDRTVKGIYAIKGKVLKASDLEKLSRDNGIYLVDVTQMKSLSIQNCHLSLKFIAHSGTLKLDNNYTEEFPFLGIPPLMVLGVTI
jgi:hypothetical protein